MFNNLQNEISNLIDRIETFWGNNVSDIQVVESTDIPFGMFTIKMKLYGQNDVIMEYERSTLGISVKKGDSYIILSKLTDEPIYRGLKSYLPGNLLYNFHALDKLLYPST